MQSLAAEADEFEGFPDLPEQAGDASSESAIDDEESFVMDDEQIKEILNGCIEQQDYDELGDGTSDEDDGEGEDGDEDEDRDGDEASREGSEQDSHAQDSPASGKPPPPTAEESKAVRRILHELGSEGFVKHMITSGRHDPAYVIEALGVKLPFFIDEFKGDAYVTAITHLLGAAIKRELARRVRLDAYRSLDDVVGLIERANNIIVVTGAGISTSLGIPDFRSKDTGLYSQLQARGYYDPTDVFDIDVFREDPSLFYSVAKDILPSTKRFTPTHAFIADLDRRGKLLTNYTQNIDNIESAAGISADRLVQCHGSFKTATCFTCGFRVDGELVFPEIKAGNIPACSRCAAEAEANNKRKRAANGTEATQNKRRPGGARSASRATSDDDDDDDDGRPNLAVMKPDITFFGEALPDAFHDRLTQHDRDKVDLLIVIGTSLKVRPVSEISAVLPPDVPQIYINRDPIGHVTFDILLLGDCDVVVAELAKRLKWDFKHEMIPDDQEVTVQTDEEDNASHWVRVAKPLPVREDKPVVVGEGDGEVQETA
ncbi:NAD-dependent protein deacetylase hst1 [Ceratocystis lukuohia]|uniref:NAD-dependent protein deacetylase hst1 n=1 Tax=Ceratocystis lukuohia TaxID=2019550 RepID=A0ABR4MJE5_9PEZI